MDSARKYRFQKKVSEQIRYGELMQQDISFFEDEKLQDKDVKEKAINPMQKTVFKNPVKNSRELSNAIDEFRQQCMRYIFALLFGERNEKQYDKENASLEEWMQEPIKSMTQGNEKANIAVEVFDFQKEIIQTEQETTSFSTVGRVKTEDGRNLQFHLEVEMSRSFTSYYQEHYRMETVKVCDPLVLNLSGNIANIKDQKFYFDIDADGEKEQIGMLDAQSGYLAYDQNEDGKINDGAELFGTKTGDGFKDLEKYDVDGNGWIDESDPLFDKLKIWCKDPDGKDVLYKLKEKDIGAICLQRTNTEFALKNQNTNQTKGYIRNTGIFLYESGWAGTVQHVDVAKHLKAYG